MNGWILGYLVGGVVVVLLVTILVMLIVAARRTAQKAERIAAELRVARDRSAALQGLDAMSITIKRMQGAAKASREALTDKSPA